MSGQTIILNSPHCRDLARQMINVAPAGSVVNVKAATRSNDQNAKMWAMLSDISRAKPDGRTHTPDVWKALFMNACGYEVQFLHGLDGNPFPAGFKSSKLSKAQMAELITFIYAYGDEHKVKWSDRALDQEVA